jgi:hypothetical protein
MPTKEKDSTKTLQQCQHLWEEYKYRHDLIWQRIFRFTSVVVLISIIPYVQQNITCLLDIGILIAPILATCLAGFVWIVMRNELKLFGKIKTAYRREQNKLLDDDLKHDLSEGSDFAQLVLWYLGSLLILSFANILIVGLIWLEKIRDLSTCVT